MGRIFSVMYVTNAQNTNLYIYTSLNNFIIFPVPVLTRIIWPRLCMFLLLCNKWMQRHPQTEWGWVWASCTMSDHVSMMYLSNLHNSVLSALCSPPCDMLYCVFLLHSINPWRKDLCSDCWSNYHNCPSHQKHTTHQEWFSNHHNCWNCPSQQ